MEVTRVKRGDEAISPEAKWKPAGNKGKHTEGQHMETSGSAWEHNWVVGSQILTNAHPCHDPWSMGYTMVMLAIAHGLYNGHG